MQDLVAATSQFLGARAQRWTRLHGGDLSAVVRILLEDGLEVVAKSGPRPRIEADMLRRIVRAGAPAPEVMVADDHLLIMRAMENDGQIAWGDLGRVLARLHNLHGKHYGWHEDYAFGTVRIENGQTDVWPQFWAACRLKPSQAYLPKSLAVRLGTLIADLPNRLPANPPASLLHGDLWSGNILSARGRISALIDPACYYGHGEVDIAMLRLFDRPEEAFFEAYKPDADWMERQPVYQLWPALVHVRLFGSDYYPLVEKLLDAAGV